MPSINTSVTICIPCLLLGGSELATLSLVKALIQGGHYDVSICCYYEHEATMVSRFEQAGARVELLGLSRGSLRCLFSILVKYFCSCQPDAVHVQYFAPGMVPILAARRAGVKRIFATVHSAGQEGYGWKAKAMLRFAARFTEHFFCVSQNAERFWFGSVSAVEEPADWPMIHHSTIHNCVDVTAIQSAGRLADRHTLCPELPSGAKVVGIVGRLVPLKGHVTLLRAMKDVLAAVPDAFLLAIGEGSHEAVLRREAERLGIADRVIWKGRVEPELLSQYYHLMDVLAMPSHWEGFGLTAVEAMAAGKPVVATDVLGLREVVEEGGTGFLVPVGDAEALAAKLLMFLCNERRAREMGQRGCTRGRNLFDIVQCSDRWCKAYDSLLSMRSG